MSKVPVGCGKFPDASELDNWQHWEWDASPPHFHCEWPVEDVRKYGGGKYQLCSGGSIGGLFHKRCLQKEGFIW
jgi:hypothetical protein